MTDYDRRLVDLYDEDNPDGSDHDFYRALADALDATSVLDLGCGTGLLTVTFARPGRRVVGVDPSPNMLDYAKRRDGASAVEWILGDSAQITAGPFDLAVMTGNVVQHIDDEGWIRSLHDLHAALGPGGHIAFESRNPSARAWEDWNSAERTERATTHGPLVEWMDAAEVNPGVVELRAYNLFSATNETVSEQLRLHFRTRQTLHRQLGEAGFEVVDVFGDWARAALTDASPLIIVVARSLPKT